MNQISRTKHMLVPIIGALLLALLAMVAVYSLIFHLLMLREGRDHSWFTGIYWTLTVMSTLGFGDITFNTDLGRVFSMTVLLTGTIRGHAEPVAWIRPHRGGRVFGTSLGELADFRRESFRRLLANAVHWTGNAKGGQAVNSE